MTVSLSFLAACTAATSSPSWYAEATPACVAVAVHEVIRFASMTSVAAMIAMR